MGAGNRDGGRVGRVQCLDTGHQGGVYHLVKALAFDMGGALGFGSLSVAAGLCGLFGQAGLF